MAIHDILEKLARLRDIDHHCLLFGADAHRYRLNPPLDQQQVARFETEHEIELPADYREFITKIGDGGAGPSCGLSSLSRAAIWGPLKDAFPFTDAVVPFEAPDGISDDEYDALHARCHAGCLLIGHQGCGIWTMLIVTGQERGKIWFDHSAEDRGFRPARVDFATWYDGWLDESLADHGLRERLEKHWEQATCLGFPQQCPKCFGKNVRSSDVTSLGTSDFVSSWNSTAASNRTVRVTCCDCGYSVEQVS